MLKSPNSFTETFQVNVIDYVLATLAVSLATLLAVSLETWVTNTNLVLVYVLAVIVIGLRYGSIPAIAGSFLSFLSFNYFLTEPRYTFHVIREDELGTLLFLFLIAVTCGPAASRIRHQFILLKKAHQYSEALRNLSQSLSMAENTEAVWQATASALSTATQAECYIASMDQGTRSAMYPTPSTAIDSTDLTKIKQACKKAMLSDHTTEALHLPSWTLFPIKKEQKCIACALVRFDSGPHLLESEHFYRELISAMLSQAADTWQRIQLVSALESARIKTEIEQLRSALLSSVSHDLRSPLSAMMGAAESLYVLDQQLSAQDRVELADTILQESRRLDSYIQNLIDMTRLGHGALKIERDWVSVADVIGSALSRLKRHFSSVKTNYQERTPPPLMYVHPALLEQALFNILENAARFSPLGEPITVTVQQRANTCIIEIEDKGPGIPQALREQVFDMFYVVSEGDRKQQNTGMGLAICRGMVGAHGGNVRATVGTDNIGTRFIVELPITDPWETDGDNTNTPEKL